MSSLHSRSWRLLDNFIFIIIDIMKKKSITNVKNKSDKMLRFTFPEHGFVVEAKNIREAEEKAEKIISKK